MEVDTTFNTNRLRLPLSVPVGITNTNLTFQIAFSFIPSESAKSFDFVEEQMKLLMWYDCHKPRVVVGNQAKGLIALMAQAETRQVRVGGAPEDRVILQLCEHHAAQNIRKRVLQAGKYNKDQYNELTGFLWDYIKSRTLPELEGRRERLLTELKTGEREYL